MMESKNLEPLKKKGRKTRIARQLSEIDDTAPSRFLFQSEKKKDNIFIKTARGASRNPLEVVGNARGTSCMGTAICCWSNERSSYTACKD